jgi:integrase
MNSADTDETGPTEDGHQLFTVVRGISLPESPSFDNETARFETSTQSRDFPALVLMSWPNGYPCVEMELYLLRLAENGARVDRNGGTVRQEAVKLSHMVRYCFRTKLNFWDMWSSHFLAFLYFLVKEKRDNGELKRESTQVIEISDSCIRFFTWLQETLLPHRRIVDVRGKPHQILLKVKKTTDVYGRVHISQHFARNPARSTPNLKEPMPKESIDALFAAISRKSDSLRENARFQSRFATLEKLERYLDFRDATWDTALTICMTLGCRPSELAQMSLSTNIRSMMDEKKLTLSTKKREPKAGRKVEVRMGTIIKVNLYIKKRERILAQLRTEGKNPAPSDGLFLNSQGNPLTPETLERGFDRLCDEADIGTRTCLSMFRHRAITTLMAIHLAEFCSGRLDVAMQALNDSDYKTILTKVAQITGHKQPESLKPYIHLAWDELGAFDTVQAAVTIHTMLLTIVSDLTPKMKKLETVSVKELRESCTNILFQAREAAKELEVAIAAFRHVKANPELLKDREFC